MQEKIIHIPFNRNLFIAGRRKAWAFSTRNIYKPYITYTIMSIICLMVGLYGETNNEFPTGKIIGGGLLVCMLLAWITLVEKRIKFFKNTRIYADRFEKEKMDCVYIFNETGIHYRDNEKMYQLSWHLFKPFEAYKGTIYLKLKDGQNVAFYLSRQELGDTVYSELYTILEEKTG